MASAVDGEADERDGAEAEQNRSHAHNESVRRLKKV